MGNTDQEPGASSPFPERAGGRILGQLLVAGAVVQAVAAIGPTEHRVAGFVVAFVVAAVGGVLWRVGGKRVAWSAEWFVGFLAATAFSTPLLHRTLGVSEMAMLGGSVVLAQLLLTATRARIFTGALLVVHCAVVQLITDGGIVSVAVRWAGPAFWWTVCGIAVGQSRELLHRRLTRLDHSAHADPLTDLPNRKMFGEQAEWALGLAKRTNHNMSLMLIDLDHFKEINDTLGHHAGDLLLQMVGPRLRGLLRATDVIARLGGDEFAVLLPEVSDPAAAIAVARKLVASLIEPFLVDGKPLTVGASIGVAVFPHHGDRLDILTKRADLAMYTSKETRNTATLYAHTVDITNARALALSSDLRKAIKSGDVRVHFQPKLHLASGRITGVEVSLHWLHSAYGWIRADEFVPIAERGGHANALLTLAFRTAICQCRAWLDHGVRLSVGLSVPLRVLQESATIAQLGGLLAEHRVPAELITIQIGDPAHSPDGRGLAAAVHELRGLGTAILVDHVGTEPASFTELRGLAVDEVRIDAAIVADLHTPGGVNFASAIVQLGATVAGAVSASGVTEGSSLRTLRSIGCTSAQGPVIAEAMPADRLASWLGLRARSSPSEPAIRLPAASVPVASVRGECALRSPGKVW